MGLRLPDEKQPDTGTGKARERGGREKERKRKRAKHREIQITNKTAVVDSGQMYQSIQSRNNIFSVQVLFFLVLVCVRHGK